jgi:quinol monooxygenase YgiN
MLVVHVHVRVRPGSEAAFAAAPRENARQSVREPGVVRFDVAQQADDPTRFVLVEVYRGADDPARHKETAHYAVWRDAVEPMMAEPRRSVRYAAAFPEPAGWELPGGGAQ